MDACDYSLENERSDQYDTTYGEKVVKSKMPRRRKREFYNKVREQMEFYFGDANLSKDRFLMKLIMKDKYVPLETFMQFNKIKKLVTVKEEIAKALIHSKLLQLNEDKSKVCRITDIPCTWDADNRTIYVESLPPTADHDWVKNIFSRFGEVAYISLPRFIISKKIKEFGFVEFTNEESFQKAMDFFKSIDSVIASDLESAEELRSIQAYQKEQIENNQPLVKTESEKKRKLSSDDLHNEVKRPKLEDLSTDSNTKQSSSEETSSSDQDEEYTVQMEAGNDLGHKKKKRRRKKKKCPKKTSDFDLSELKVLSKCEWKKLRNMYLNMQRKKFSEIKQELRKKNNYSSRSRTAAKRVEVKKPQSMNFYGAAQDEEKTAEDEDKIKQITSIALKRKPLFKYEPDIIVKIKMCSPCIDLKSFKADMRQYPGVLYVDVTEGAFEAHVRCESSRYAKNFKKRVSNAEYMCELLSGDQEIEYWNKIMRDREMKLNKIVKTPYKRGKQKLTALAAKHILFDDQD